MRTLIVAFMVLSTIGSARGADAPDAWSYHGIHLGAKMTQDQIMHALGADKYTNNPKYDPWNKSKGCDNKPDQKICKEADFYKYGSSAIEWEEWQIGPSCEDDPQGGFSCQNPWIAGSQLHWDVHGHGVCQVYVFVRDGVVSSIDIKFNSEDEQEFFDVVHRQLGPGWHVEQDSMYITESGNPKKGILVDRTIETKKTKLYRAMMTNYDLVHTHVAGPMYQGILELKLIDQSL